MQTHTVTRGEYASLAARMAIQEARMQAHFAAIAVLAVGVVSRMTSDLGNTTAILTEYRDYHLEASNSPNARDACASAAIASEMDAILTVLATVDSPCPKPAGSLH